MSTMITIPDELVEQIKSIARTEPLDQFLIDAARKQVREIRARQLREEYERAQRRQTPRQIYEQTLAQVVEFETKYACSSEQFLQDFESGALDEDPGDWIAFYRWRTLAYGLRRMEQEYHFTREAQVGGNGQA